MTVVPSTLTFTDSTPQQVNVQVILDGSVPGRPVWDATGDLETPARPSDELAGTFSAGLFYVTMQASASDGDAWMDGGAFAVSLYDKRVAYGDTLDNPVVVDQFPFSKFMRLDTLEYGKTDESEGIFRTGGCSYNAEPAYHSDLFFAFKLKDAVDCGTGCTLIVDMCDSQKVQLGWKYTTDSGPYQTRLVRLTPASPSPPRSGSRGPPRGP